MSRPAGDVRKALAQAAQQLADEHGAATWRDMADRVQVGYRVACRTVHRMAEAGALECVGAEKRAHSRRWMNLYAPATPCVVPALDDACARALADVAHAWARPRCVQGVAMT
jgi:hypothetical protein